MNIVKKYKKTITDKNNEIRELKEELLRAEDIIHELKEQITLLKSKFLVILIN